MEDTLRAFFALNLDVEASRRAADTSRRARAHPQAPRASWEPPTRFHVTLRFLGDIDPGLSPALGDMMRQRLGRFPAPKLRLGALQAFPRLAAARVLFVEILDPSSALKQMFSALEDGLAEMGFEREPRPYVPHLTLARLRASADLRPWLAALPPTPASDARGIECVLYRSHLTQVGAEYTPLEMLPLR